MERRVHIQILLENEFYVATQKFGPNVLMSQMEAFCDLNESSHASVLIFNKCVAHIHM